MKKRITYFCFALMISLLFSCEKENDEVRAPEPCFDYYLMYREGQQYVCHEQVQESVCSSLQGYCAVFSYQGEELYTYLNLDKKVNFSDMTITSILGFSFNKWEENHAAIYLPDGSILPDSVVGYLVVNQISDLETSNGMPSRVITGTFKMLRSKRNVPMDDWLDGRFRFRIYD